MIRKLPKNYRIELHEYYAGTGMGDDRSEYALFAYEPRRTRVGLFRKAMVTRWWYVEGSRSSSLTKAVERRLTQTAILRSKGLA